MLQGIKRLIIVTGLLAAILLSATGLFDRALEAGGLKHLSRTNGRYLDNAFDKSLSGFLLLSSIKSGLAVVEGSEVGVGFSLQLGDVVQPVYDYVDIAWKAALAGGSIIVGMELALQGLDLLAHWVLTGVLLVLLLELLAGWYLPGWRRLQSGFKEMIRFGTSVTLAFYLLLPLSVTAAAALSNIITRPVIEASHEELKQIDRQIRPQEVNQEALADMAKEGLSEPPSLKTRLNDTAAGIGMLITFLKIETEKVAAMSVKLIAAYIFDCILFPLFFGLIFMTMLRSGVRYFFEIGPGQ